MHVYSDQQTPMDSLHLYLQLSLVVDVTHVKQSSNLQNSVLKFEFEFDLHTFSIHISDEICPIFSCIHDHAHFQGLIHCHVVFVALPKLLIILGQAWLSAKTIGRHFELM